MKVLVCGSRDWSDRNAIVRRLVSLPPGTVVLHGGAHGADDLAGDAAAACGLAVHVYPARWKEDGNRAGILRNLRMLDTVPDLVIAFWDGESRGTKHTITEAKRRGIDVEVIS